MGGRSSQRTNALYQLGWAGISGTCELEGSLECPMLGDKFMANHGFSKSLFKVNIWGWQLAAKWAYGAIRPMGQLDLWGHYTYGAIRPMGPLDLCIYMFFVCTFQPLMGRCRER